jgi:hypothetical protein
VIGSGSARVSRVGFGVSPKQAFRSGTFRKGNRTNIALDENVPSEKFAMA